MEEQSNKLEEQNNKLKDSNLFPAKLLYIFNKDSSFKRKLKLKKKVIEEAHEDLKKEDSNAFLNDESKTNDENFSKLTSCARK